MALKIFLKALALIFGKLASANLVVNVRSITNQTQLVHLEALHPKVEARKVVTAPIEDLLLHPVGHLLKIVVVRVLPDAKAHLLVTNGVNQGSAQSLLGHALIGTVRFAISSRKVIVL